MGGFDGITLDDVVGMAGDFLASVLTPDVNEKAPDLSGLLAKGQTWVAALLAPVPMADESPAPREKVAVSIHASKPALSVVQMVNEAADALERATQAATYADNKTKAERFTCIAEGWRALAELCHYRERS